MNKFDEMLDLIKLQITVYNISTKEVIDIINNYREDVIGEVNEISHLEERIDGLLYNMDDKEDEINNLRRRNNELFIEVDKSQIKRYEELEEQIKVRKDIIISQNEILNSIYDLLKTGIPDYIPPEQQYRWIKDKLK